MSKYSLCSLRLFEGRVTLVKSMDAWNEYVCSHHGKKREELSDRLFISESDNIVGMEARLARSDETNAPTTFLIGVFDDRIRTFVHELAHAVFDICGYYGIPTEAGEANEFFCYTYDFLFDHFQPDFS